MGTHRDIRLILTDIDGTILPEGHAVVSCRTREAFRVAARAGMRMGPASGRGISHVLPAFGGDESCVATALATNGMQVYLDGALIHEEHLDHGELVRVAEALHDLPHAGLIVFDEGTPLLVEGRRQDLAASFPLYASEAKAGEGVPPFAVVKANVFTSEGLAATRRLKDLLEREVPGLEFNIPVPGFVNLTPVGYSKASGVDILCDALGISIGQVVVFGDSGNDLEMLAHVPDSVAVENATAEAHEAARWHIGPCDQESVAQAVEVLAAGEWPFGR